MKAMTGKSTGIALLMAAALLAALFAMGVFSATGVKAQETSTPAVLATLVLETQIEGEAGVALTITQDNEAGTAYSDADLATVTGWRTTDVPKGTTSLLVSPTVADAAEQQIEVQWLDQTGQFADADDTDTGNVDESTDVFIDLAKGIPGEIRVVVSDANDDNNDTAATNFVTTTYTVKVNYDSPTNSATAGAGVRIVLEGTVVASTGDVIAVNMKGFGLPPNPDANHFTLQQGTNQAKASDVTRSGDVLEITVPDMNGDGDELIGLVATSATTISISSRAGVTNPTAAGLYGISINDDDATGGDEAVDSLNIAMVERSVSLKPAKGSSTADVTVTGKGFGSGSATVFIDKTPGAEEDDASTTDVDETVATYEANHKYDAGVDEIIASGVTITDGSFTAVIAGISKPAGEDAVSINAFDGGSAVAAASKAYTFASGLSIDPESISWGQTLTLKMSDNAQIPTEVRFGGNNAYKVDVESGATAKEAKVVVPAGVPVGKQNVEVISSSGVVAGLSSSVEIVPLDLSISPSDPVPGQRITIRGSGFADSAAITGITFGSADEITVPAGSTATSTGRVTFTYNVPLDVGTGSKKVSLSVGDRTGEGSITVPKPSISIDPAESLIGSVVTVTGTGFASSERVEVLYAGEIEAVGISDSDGNVDLRVTVPSTAGIGASNPIEVQVRDQAGEDITASATHRTPGAMITVSDEVVPGGTMTIMGHNFQAYSLLTVVTVGGQNVLPSPAPETDRRGTFEFQVRVPLLSIGSHNITVEDGDNNSATESFSVVSAVASTDPVEVFADLIENGTLSTVWHLDASTQTWSSFSTDPDLAAFNDLTAIQGGQVYVLIMTAADTFRGTPLFAGTNQVFIP